MLKSDPLEKHTFSPSLARTLLLSDIVVVHDAVRPFVSGEIISDCIAACQRYGNGLSAIRFQAETIVRSVNPRMLLKSLQRIDNNRLIIDIDKLTRGRT